ncbi:MAG: AGE family epimerase/isomerase [Bifidobacteriaceae bacterium]|jgi:mannose/cellobiose epimerase-like protein (N-acyl-D-glucosamine 2-epimerase family)|nr:AGE family epimerase/isomerase [Bifidobacteriaceae bacterium]
MNSPDYASDPDWLNTETFRLLDFGRASADSPQGFAWLDAAGRPDLTGPVDLWITARMTHVYALGTLLGYPGAEDLTDHGLAALAGPFADTAAGGWFNQIAADGTPTDLDKTAYGHAFVLLATASAVAAGRPGADDLLARALANQNAHFWDPAESMVVDSFNQDFTAADPFRGINSNMHTVEAYLAAADVTGDKRWRRRARRITRRVVRSAQRSDWRVLENFTADWQPMPDYNIDRPADQFRPYGATPGHGFEWSRLILEIEAAMGANARDWMRPAAEQLFRRAHLDGWRDEPTPGFIYTTDWHGQAVLDTRLQWVAAEAVAAAITAYRATGDPVYRALYDRWWDTIEQIFLDRELGSWHHEIAPSGQVGKTLWDGKPDIYHAVQATLFPRLPVTPSLATALKEGLLDQV